jgi:hypothetical protein
MIVILCHPHDRAAVWLDDILRRLGVRKLELVAVEQVVFSRHVVHRVTGEGDTGAIRLADGRLLRPEAITGLVNRVQYVPTGHFARAPAIDRVYAASELGAFMLAWLNGVAGRVINPPRPLDFGGGTFDAPTLVHLASMAGLPTAGWRGSTTDEGSGAAESPLPTHTVVVFDGRVFGPLVPGSVQEGSRRLAALLGVPLLEVRFHDSPTRRWRFVSASGLVDFQRAGTPLAAGIARALDVSVSA